MSSVTGDRAVALSAADTAADANLATPQHLLPNLPDNPLITIQPSQSWAINFHEIWKYRGLLYFLTGAKSRVVARSDWRIRKSNSL
jgi:hypothetical protein